MAKDRKDGKRIIENEAIHAIMPFIYDKRTEAEVYIKETLDITELKNWVDKQNKKLDFKMTYFHALTSVFAKTIYNRPLLNRFVQNSRIYERNVVSFSFVAKNKMADDAKDMIIIIDAKNNENAIEFSRRMAVDIFETKKNSSNDLNSVISKFLKLPTFILKLVVKVFKWLDRHDLLPTSYTKTDSNYATMLLSNLGSIKSESCYHHLNNYGTNSIIITIGIIKELGNRTVVDISATLDERIASGFYFAKSIKLAQHIINNPKLLEENLSSEVLFEE